MLIPFLLGLFIGVGLFYFGAELGFKKGCAQTSAYYAKFINSLPWEIKKAVRDHYKTYVLKRDKR